MLSVSPVTHWLQTLRDALPEGNALPLEIWRTRHRGLVVFLFLHAVGLTLFALMTGHSLLFSLAVGTGIAVWGWLGSVSRFNIRVRACLVSCGFLTSSALLVHLSGGYIEMHFHYFVMVTILALYEDWVPFSLSVGYVVIQHGLGGLFFPHMVFNHSDAWGHPWKWALIHAGFLLGACAGAIVVWRSNEANRAEVESLMQSTAEGIVGANHAGEIIFVNEGAAHLTGYSRRELLGAPLSGLFVTTPPELATPDYRDGGRADVASQEFTQASHSGEALLARRDGVSVPVEYRLGPLKCRGEILGAVLTLTNLVELKRAEERLQLVIESTPNGMLMVNQNGLIVLVNANIERMFGYRLDELLGQPVSMLVPERFRPGHRAHVQGYMACPAARHMGAGRELFGVRKDGTEFPVEIGLNPVETPNGVQALAAIVDITERKKAEAALRQAKESAERAAREKAAIFSAVKVFFISIDEADKVTEWTPAAESLFGISLCDAIDKALGELPIGWNWDDLRSHIERCRETLQSVNLDRVLIKKEGGEHRFARVAINAVLSDTAVGVVLMGEDITERLRLEQELAQAQKLESIGQLAAGIAHEINTPTQFVGDNTRFVNDSFTLVMALLLKYRQLVADLCGGSASPGELAGIKEAEKAADVDYLGEEIPKALAQSIEGIERIATIVRAMKEFAHPDTGEKAAVDLNKTIESTITVARNEWKYVAEMATDFDPALPPVRCLPGDINQVMLNLIVNAAHAIGDVVQQTGGKGRITVSTKSAGEWAEIRVADTGTGIPEAIHGRLFDPFFTTKEVGKGTGQGLSIARTVVTEKHGGRLTFETEVGKGTTFIIRLPIHMNEGVRLMSAER